MMAGDAALNLLSNDSVDGLVDPAAIMMVGDLPSDNSNLMADLDDNGSLLGTGGGSPMEFFGSVNTPLISPTTTASVITSGRSVTSGGGTTASFYHQGADLNPS